jgi:hypothetical protein
MGKLANWFALVFAILTLALVIAERLGALDWYLDLKPMQKAAENLSSSYAPATQRIFTPAHSEWLPTIRLIRKYTSKHLPESAQPKAIARFRAVLSDKEDLSQGAVAEWTAPSTPIALIYGPGKALAVGADHVVIVGDIGDLSRWIAEYRDYWKFLLNDVLLGVLSVATALLAFLGTRRQNRDS